MIMKPKNMPKQRRRISHQLEFRFMGIKPVKGIKREGFERIYSLGSDFLGEKIQIEQTYPSTGHSHVWGRIEFIQLDSKLNPINIRYPTLDGQTISAHHIVTRGLIHEAKSQDRKVTMEFPAEMQKVVFKRKRRAAVISYDTWEAMPEDKGQWKRKGIAMQLMKSLEEEARKHGIKVLIGIIENTNTESQSIAKAAGLKPMFERKDKEAKYWIKEL